MAAKLHGKQGRAFSKPQLYICGNRQQRGKMQQRGKQARAFSKLQQLLCNPGTNRSLQCKSERVAAAGRGMQGRRTCTEKGNTATARGLV